jgi:hypothetical protein
MLPWRSHRSIGDQPGGLVVAGKPRLMHERSPASSLGLFTVAPGKGYATISVFRQDVVEKWLGTGVIRYYRTLFFKHRARGRAEVNQRRPLRPIAVVVSWRIGNVMGHPRPLANLYRNCGPLREDSHDGQSGSRRGRSSMRNHGACAARSLATAGRCHRRERNRSPPHRSPRSTPRRCRRYRTDQRHWLDNDPRLPAALFRVARQPLKED